MTDPIRTVLADHARLSVDPETLGEDEDLYRHGFTSHASVSVMLALEEAFDVEFPNRMLRKSTFSSVQSIRDALGELGARKL
jgi:acyl carrier protein